MRETLACQLSDQAFSNRRRRLASLFRERLETSSFEPDSVRLDFPYDAERVRQLGDLMALESQCCPTLRQELIVDPSAESVSLTLSGPAGAGEAVWAELAGGAETPRAGAARSLAGAGVTGGLFATLCCLAPPMLGLGTAASFLAEGLAVGIAAGAAIALALAWRRRSGSACG